MTTLLYRTTEGPVARIDGRHYRVGPDDWDELLNFPALAEHLREQATPAQETAPPTALVAPLESQEIWGAGVTWYRSRDARIEESRDAGGGDFYDRVYDAERPELFYKANRLRVAPPGGLLRLRTDSNWIVPEPELTLVINNRHRIIGYTVGNDLSCRDIEGENPLYLPQAKTFDGCAAIGPGLLITNEVLPETTRIALRILRNGRILVDDSTELSLMKRRPEDLLHYLVRAARFPAGCFLMTGTGIVPADDFSLQRGDEVRITIEPIGTLVNLMGVGHAP